MSVRAPGPTAMAAEDLLNSQVTEAVEEFDVLIVGAGLSGIGAAVQLQARLPAKTYAILESRAESGGTWDLFRYPGVRSDSDMFTLGYSFRPWLGERSIAAGEDILRYIRDTAKEHRVDRHIRYHHRVESANWSGESQRWTLTVRRLDIGREERLTCRFLFVCAGYYRYDKGFRPRFAGEESFRGQLVHPQFWPPDLDYQGKRVVVIGSGATAITLVPAMAATAGQVTMLQRSPSYILSLPGSDRLAVSLQRALPPRFAYLLIRWKNVALSTLLYQLSRRRPQTVKKLLRRGLLNQLPPGFDVDRHFTPRYDPWDQRLCLAPDGDFFAAIRAGKVSIVTDAIETFTDTGIRLVSGEELPAEVVVTATGLELVPLGGVRITVDGERVALGECFAYKGMMLSDVPNLAFTVGYTNASWTLKADLVAGYVCRLLKHMDARGLVECRPIRPTTEPAPLLDLSSGYVARSVASLPKQGSAAPWRVHQNYPRDLLLFKRSAVDDPAMSFR